MRRDVEDELLLGEWACLGILYQGPSHGFAVAARLKPDGDVGRVWALSRPLTYRSLDQLVGAGLVAQVGEERGIAGGNRTILSPTRRGRARLRAWVTRPVEHLRDLRSELLLKLVVAEQCKIDVAEMLDAQQVRVAEIFAHLEAHAADDPSDVVTRWRRESARAALRFVEQVRSGRDRGRGEPRPRSTTRDCD